MTDSNAPRPVTTARYLCIAVVECGHNFFSLEEMVVTFDARKEASFSSSFVVYWLTKVLQLHHTLIALCTTKICTLYTWTHNNLYERFQPE